MSRPPEDTLYGYNYLSSTHWTQVPWMLGKIVSFPLACEEIDHLGLLGQMRSSPHHGGVTSRVVDVLTHMGWPMMQGGAADGVVFSGAQSCTTEFNILERSTKVYGGVSRCVSVHCGIGATHTTSRFYME